ncbi:hypothetical protein H4R22_001984, partial [Coemansia sp. RSA 1290]
VVGSSRMEAVGSHRVVGSHREEDIRKVVGIHKEEEDIRKVVGNHKEEEGNSREEDMADAVGMEAAAGGKVPNGDRNGCTDHSKASAQDRFHKPHK